MSSQFLMVNKEAVTITVVSSANLQQLVKLSPNIIDKNEIEPWGNPCLNVNFEKKMMIGNSQPPYLCNQQIMVDQSKAFVMSNTD